MKLLQAIKSFATPHNMLSALMDLHSWESAFWFWGRTGGDTYLIKNRLARIELSDASSAAVMCAILDGSLKPLGKKGGRWQPELQLLRIRRDSIAWHAFQQRLHGIKRDSIDAKIWREWNNALSTKQNQSIVAAAQVMRSVDVDSALWKAAADVEKYLQSDAVLEMLTPWADGQKLEPLSTEAIYALGQKPKEPEEPKRTFAQVVKLPTS